MNSRKANPATGKVANRAVPFMYHAPGAKQVCVTGDFTQWNQEGVPLHMRSDDEWRATLKLAPGRYEYRLIVDGEWRDDPNARETVPNAFGTQNGVIEVR